MPLTVEDITATLQLLEGAWGTMSADRILLGKSSLPPLERERLALQRQYAPKMARKFPSFCHLPFFLPSALSFEQSTSEAAARYKASRLGAHPYWVDGTGGLGVDFAFMSASAQQAHYIEQQEALVAAASYNTPLIHQHLSLDSPPKLYYHLGNLFDKLPSFVQEGMTALYFDPARRGSLGNRTYALSQTEPSPLEVCAQLRALHYRGKVFIKISPMADIHEVIRLLPQVAQIDIIEVGGEVKELLLMIPHIDEGAVQPQIRAISLTSEGEVKASFEGDYETEAALTPSYATPLERYLYIPSAALFKSQLFRSVAHHYAITPLHPHSHVYTSCSKVEPFFGSVYTIEEVISAHSSTLKRLKKRFPQAEFSQRNFPLSPQVFYQRTGIKPGGTTRLLGTTLHDGSAVILHLLPLQP